MPCLQAMPPVVLLEQHPLQARQRGHVQMGIPEMIGCALSHLIPDLPDLRVIQPEIPAAELLHHRDSVNLFIFLHPLDVPERVVQRHAVSPQPVPHDLRVRHVRIVQVAALAQDDKIGWDVLAAQGIGDDVAALQSAPAAAAPAPLVGLREIDAQAAFICVPRPISAQFQGWSFGSVFSP